MRHQNKTKNIGSASASHRKSKLNLLSTALFKHKKIVTTIAKAKATRIFAEKLITIAKRNDIHSRRLVARFIREKDVVKELFSEIIEKVGDRKGGYTRIVKLGHRYGDGAEMAVLELVDFNLANVDKEQKKIERKEAKKEEAKAAAEEKQEEKEVVEEKVEKEAEVKEAEIIEEEVKEAETPATASDEKQEEIKKEEDSDTQKDNQTDKANS